MSRALHAAVLALAVIAGGAAGCSDQTVRTDAPPTAQPSGKLAAKTAAGDRRAVDAGLMAFLSKARAAHHSADLAESKGDVELAIRHVETIPYGPIPPLGPEVIEVLADAHSRLAELKSQLARFDDAAREVDRGLVIATETTHFRGHLFESRGVVEERRMTAHEKAGNTRAADTARKAALEAFETAMTIQDEVIRNALPDPAPAPSGAPSAPAPRSSGP
jgi:hypothetical protein